MKDCLSKASEAADYLVRTLSRSGKKEEIPALAVILGTGLGGFAKSLVDRKSVSYARIPHFPRTAVAGHVGTFSLGKVRGCSVICLEGRVHYYEGHDSTKVTFPVRVLGILGVQILILTNAAGSLKPGLRPGSLMLIRDHLSSFIPNPLIGPNQESLGPRFLDMSQCYSSRLRAIALRCARTLRLRINEGIYVGVTGPSYETPAEIRMFQKLGADAIGMSTVPEVIVARHMGIECLGISVITNLATGISKTPLTHDEVIRTSQTAGQRLLKLLNSICCALTAETSMDGRPS
ncbi:MAG TPA: purine-nucleoside phosphorylase [Terriglobia bacterium]|nr:purine-nucleoside phosphorylase [Terriglobia bacterium]